MVAHTYNCSTQEVEAEGLWAPGQPQLHSRQEKKEAETEGGKEGRWAGWFHCASGFPFLDHFLYLPWFMKFFQWPPTYSSICSTCKSSPTRWFYKNDYPHFLTKHQNHQKSSTTLLLKFLQQTLVVYGFNLPIAVLQDATSSAVENDVQDNIAQIQNTSLAYWICLNTRCLWHEYSELCPQLRD